jgi:ABC-type phosphate transport system permease subunit
MLALLCYHYKATHELGDMVCYERRALKANISLLAGLPQILVEGLYGLCLFIRDLEKHRVLPFMSSLEI